MSTNDFLSQLPPMMQELPFAITVCDTGAIILYMNDASINTFKKYGGTDILGTSLFNYHNSASSAKLRQMLDNETGNTYTIEKNGVKKIIHQLPWYKGGKFAGLIELSLEIPFEMPHFIRD